MPHVRSWFYTLRADEAFIYLMDMDGTVSMTNDAENVCLWAHETHPGKRVAYMDTNGQWDEMIHEAGVFVAFGSLLTVPDDIKPTGRSHIDDYGWRLKMSSQVYKIAQEQRRREAISEDESLELILAAGVMVGMAGALKKRMLSEELCA